MYIQGVGTGKSSRAVYFPGVDTPLHPAVPEARYDVMMGDHRRLIQRHMRLTAGHSVLNGAWNGLMAALALRFLIESPHFQFSVLFWVLLGMMIARTLVGIVRR